jgi:hypothetical protein
MFAYFRSTPEANYRFITQHIATKMRTNVRSNVAPLTGLDPSNDEVAGVLAEIWLREFACTLQTLNQVNVIAARYHEEAFDNLDVYIGGVQPVQLPPHEMTAEQRHASQLLLGVGRSHSEVNAALRAIGLSRSDIIDHNVTKLKIMAQQFQETRTVAEDVFDRLYHVSKQVWSLVNMLAFSNLFRFANPKEPFCIPNPDDAIFIPYIPTKTHQAQAQVQAKESE